MSYFHSDFGKIYYEDVGGGQPLVFLHGRTLDSRMWQPQIEFLKSKYRCITYDLSGFGKSDIPTPNYDQVEVLHELLNYLNISKASLIGLSLGSFIAINFALQYPTFINKLILMSSAVPGTEFGPKFIADWDSMEAEGQNGNFIKAKKKWQNCKAFSKLRVNNPKYYLLFTKMIKDWTCWDIHSPPLENYKNDSTKLSTILTPALIISGRQDYQDFIDNGNLLGQKLPNSKVKILEHSSHMVNLEFPKVVNDLISDFLFSQ